MINEKQERTTSVSYCSSFASFTQLMFQLFSLCGLLSLFQRFRQGLSLLGSITFFRMAASECPSAKRIFVRRLCRFEGHCPSSVGSTFASQLPSALLSASMIISLGATTIASVTGPL